MEVLATERETPIQYLPTEQQQSNEDAQEANILSFSQNDPELPSNWSAIYCVTTSLLIVTNSTLGSSLPSGAASAYSSYFHISSSLQVPLPISVYLIGYIFGPLLFGPLSEAYGRRIITLVSFTGFTSFTLGCALAPTWPGLLAFRFLVGVCASSPIAVVGGIFADLYPDTIFRGRAITLLMAATTMGPVISPTISGFISTVSWRWSFWVGLIFAGVSWLLLFFFPETYPPLILARQAKTLRKAGSHNIYASLELEHKNVGETLTVCLTRPLKMFTQEPIVLFTCLFLSLEYAIFYLFFEAYPFIFEGVYSMTPGISGLAFLPQGIGSILAALMFLYYDMILVRAQIQQRAWSLNEEHRRLPLACLGGPLCVISLFWLGWSSHRSIHWIIPMLAGLTYGTGIELTYIALLNYLTDAYAEFAASALAASAFSRAALAVCLPIAAGPMYQKLGIEWASSLLGFVSLVMAVVPFVFLKYGGWLRERSRFCRELERRREETRREGMGEA